MDDEQRRGGSPPRRDQPGNRLRDPRLVWLVVVVGVALRLAQLLAQRSLSGDESFLALNLVLRSPLELLEQLDNNQAAPPLFLLLEKSSVELIGSTDLAVRLVPFLAGVLALVLFPFLARASLRAAAVLPATIVMAVADPLIAWTVNDKPYAVDVLVTVVVLLLAVTFGPRLADRRLLGAFAAAGAFLVWLSFPAALVLAGVGTTLLVAALVGRRTREAVAVALMAGVWLASFAIVFAISSSGIQSVQGSLDSSSGGESGNSADDYEGFDAALGVVRYVSTVPDIFGVGTREVGEPIAIVFFLLCGIGAISLWRHRPLRASLILAPLVVAAGAAIVGQYPLLPRATIYLIPIVALLAGQGIAAALASSRGVWRWASIAGTALVLGAIAAPAAYHLVHPRGTQEMRPVLRSLAGALEAEDQVYVGYAAQYGLRWYLECHCAGEQIDGLSRSERLAFRPARGGPEQWAPTLESVPPRLTVARYEGPDADDYLADLDALAGAPRVWIVLANVDDSFREAFRARLDRLGVLERTIEGDGDEGVATAYLYDLSAA